MRTKLSGALCDIDFVPKSTERELKFNESNNLDHACSKESSNFCA